MFLVDDNEKNWNGGYPVSMQPNNTNNVIGFDAPSFVAGSFNEAIELNEENGDSYLISLKEFIKNILRDKAYRSVIKGLIESRQMPFWNTLSVDGKISELTEIWH